VFNAKFQGNVQIAAEGSNWLLSWLNCPLSWLSLIVIVTFWTRKAISNSRAALY